MKNADQLLKDFYTSITKEKPVSKLLLHVLENQSDEGLSLNDLIDDFDERVNSDDDDDYDLDTWQKALPVYTKPSDDSSPEQKLAWNKQVHDAWRVISDHPIFDTAEMGFLQPEYLIDPTLEDGTGNISDDDSLNTQLRYWYEILLPFIVDLSEPFVYALYGDKPPKSDLKHVWLLDGSADSYDEAIMQIYAKIIAIYGEPVHS